MSRIDDDIARSAERAFRGLGRHNGRATQRTEGERLHSACRQRAAKGLDSFHLSFVVRAARKPKACTKLPDCRAIIAIACKSASQAMEAALPSGSRRSIAGTSKSILDASVSYFGCINLNINLIFVCVLGR